MSFNDITNGINSAVIRAFSEPLVIDGLEVLGIFDEYSIEVNAGFGVEVGHTSTAPMAWVLTDDLQANPVGAIVNRDTSTYIVKDHEPDGTGVSRLILEEQ